jgi:hypothetical protein
MQRTQLKFVFFLCITTLCGMAQVTTVPGTVSGRVTRTDAGGIPVEGAHVVVHYDHAGNMQPSSRPDVARATDRLGRYSVELEPGFYDVCIMALALTPDCRKVLVTSGKTIEHDAALRTDPLVVDRLAERVPMLPSSNGPAHSILSADGKVACLGYRVHNPFPPERQFGVWVHEPPAPPKDVLDRLAPQRRDLSDLPIRVVLRTLGAQPTFERDALMQDETPQHPRVEGLPRREGYVFALFPLDWIVAGSIIVGERVVETPDGKRVTVETRCSITAADAAQWR